MDTEIEISLGLRAFHDLRCAGSGQPALHVVGWGFAGGDVGYGGGMQAAGGTHRRSSSVIQSQRYAQAYTWLIGQQALARLPESIMRATAREKFRLSHAQAREVYADAREYVEAA